MKASFTLMFLVTVFYDVNGVDYTDLCECNTMLLPKVKGIHDYLLDIYPILEMAQTKAAVLAYSPGRNMSNHVIEAAVSLTAESALCSSGAAFLSRINSMLPMVKSVANSVSVIAKHGVTSSGGSGSLVNELDLEQPIHEKTLSDMETGCPLENTSDLYMNLSSEVTEAAHFMSEVESNEVVATNNLLCIRLMVVEMKNQTERYHGLLNRLETLPCEKSTNEETAQVRASESRDSGRFFDCACVDEVLSIAAKLEDQLQWLLPLLKEIETYGLLAASTGVSARSAPVNNDRAGDKFGKIGSFPTHGGFNTSFLGVDFIASFVNESNTREISSGRSSHNSFKSCPAQDFIEKLELAHNDVDNAIYLRENVKSDPAYANELLPNITRSVFQVEEQINRYITFKMDLEKQKC